MHFLVYSVYPLAMRGCSCPMTANHSVARQKSEVEDLIELVNDELVTRLKGLSSGIRTTDETRINLGL